jgi:hypothetical protein
MFRLTCLAAHGPLFRTRAIERLAAMNQMPLALSAACPLVARLRSRRFVVLALHALFSPERLSSRWSLNRSGCSRELPAALLARSAASTWSRVNNSKCARVPTQALHSTAAASHSVYCTSQQITALALWRHGSCGVAARYYCRPADFNFNSLSVINCAACSMAAAGRECLLFGKRYVC